MASHADMCAPRLWCASTAAARPPLPSLRLLGRLGEHLHFIKKASKLLDPAAFDGWFDRVCATRWLRCRPPTHARTKGEIGPSTALAALLQHTARAPAADSIITRAAASHGRDLTARRQKSHPASLPWPHAPAASATSIISTTIFTPTSTSPPPPPPAPPLPPPPPPPPPSPPPRSNCGCYLCPFTVPPHSRAAVSQPLCPRSPSTL